MHPAVRVGWVGHRLNRVLEPQDIPISELGGGSWRVRIREGVGGGGLEGGGWGWMVGVWGLGGEGWGLGGGGWGLGGEGWALWSSAEREALITSGSWSCPQTLTKTLS